MSESENQAHAHEALPKSALQLIADVAAQSPLVAQWLAGWLAGRQSDTTQSVRLVVDAAHLEVPG